MNFTLLPDTDPILRQVAIPVTVFGLELSVTCQRLYATMKSSRGLGLAAPQVGISKRIIVTDIQDTIIPMRYMINPKLISVEGIQKRNEGCLSFPKLYLDVERAKNVTVTFCNERGVENTIAVSGLNAVIVQHEIDHLDGKLFVDRVKPMTLALARKKLNEKHKKG